MQQQRPVALITGAASGIGRASALAFARVCGACVIVDVDEAGARETQRLVEALGVGCEAAVVRCDVSEEGDVESMALDVQQRCAHGP